MRQRALARIFRRVTMRRHAVPDGSGPAMREKDQPMRTLSQKKTPDPVFFPSGDDEIGQYRFLTPFLN